MTVIQNIASHLSVKKAGIAGAGGLGSNVAAALVRSGLGHIVIADYDVVTEANLNRQFFFADQAGQRKVDTLRENLLRINNLADVEAHSCKVTPRNAGSLFGSCDVVIEAFDLAKEKMVCRVDDRAFSLQTADHGFGNCRIRQPGNPSYAKIRQFVHLR